MPSEEKEIREIEVAESDFWFTNWKTHLSDLSLLSDLSKALLEGFLENLLRVSEIRGFFFRIINSVSVR